MFISDWNICFYNRVFVITKYVITKVDCNWKMELVRKFGTYKFYSVILAYWPTRSPRRKMLEYRDVALKMLSWLFESYEVSFIKIVIVVFPPRFPICTVIFFHAALILYLCRFFSSPTYYPWLMMPVKWAASNQIKTMGKSEMVFNKMLERQIKLDLSKIIRIRLENDVKLILNVFLFAIIL